MGNFPLGQELKSSATSGGKRPITIADRDALLRLGITQPSLPEIFATYTPTISFGDVSSLIPLPEPASGIGSMQHTYATGNHSRFALESKAAGGLRIVQLFLAAGTSVGAAIPGAWDLSRGTGPSGLTERVSLNSGQDADPAIVSTFHSDVVAGGGPATGVQLQPFIPNPGFSPVSIFVSRGSFLQVAFTTVPAFTTITSAVIIWRELPLLSRSPV